MLCKRAPPERMVQLNRSMLLSENQPRILHMPVMEVGCTDTSSSPCHSVYAKCCFQFRIYVLGFWLHESRARRPVNRCQRHRSKLRFEWKNTEQELEVGGPDARFRTSLTPLSRLLVAVGKYQKTLMEPRKLLSTKSQSRVLFCLQGSPISKQPILQSNLRIIKEHSRCRIFVVHFHAIKANISLFYVIYINKYSHWNISHNCTDKNITLILIL